MKNGIATAAAAPCAAEIPAQERKAKTCKRKPLPIVKSLKLCDRTPLNAASTVISINIIEEAGQEEL